MKTNPSSKNGVRRFFFSILIAPIIIFGCTSSTKKSDTEKEQIHKLTIDISASDPSTTYACKVDICENCMHEEYLQFDATYKDFFDDYYDNPENDKDPLASGVFIEPGKGPGGTEGSLGCNLPPPPGGSGMLNLSSQTKNLRADISSITREINVQPALSHFCAGPGNTTKRLIFSKFCLENKNIEGCSSNPSETSAFNALLNHYSCSLGELISIGAVLQEIDYSRCSDLSEDTVNCFTLIHGNDRIFNTIIRTPDPDCVIRITYSDPEVLNFLEIKR